ncbi:DUF6624 domain-containing protein [Rhodanobacter sp. BL-MT-08]
MIRRSIFCAVLLASSIVASHASDAVHAPIEQRCPGLSAWESAHPQWSEKNQAARLTAAFGKPTDPQLRQQLLNMVKPDQAAREAVAKSGFQSQDALKKMLSVDAKNLAAFKPIIQRQGFPKPSQVGVDGFKAAFLLIQHADRDPALQSQVLPQLVALHDQGMIGGSDVALLTDRVLRAQGKPQRYGTQFDQDADGSSMKLQSTEDIANLDKRRAAMDLPPMTDYACMMSVYTGKKIKLQP